MKFDQLIEYNMRSICLEKSCTGYGGGADKINIRKFYSLASAKRNT